MAEPTRLDLVARRNAPFRLDDPWTFYEDGSPIDFTGATVSMQVRLYGAAPGEPLIDLDAVGATLTEGLLLGAGTVSPFIDEATLALLPRGKDGDTVALSYDLVVDLADRSAEVWQYGLFNVKPGVTDRLGLRITDDSSYRVTDDGSIRVTG